MLKPDVASVTTTMIEAYAEMRKAGEKRPFGLSFPFRAEEVDGIHTFKAGEGAGTWFRLKDGRVFTRHGKPAATETNLYDEEAQEPAPQAEMPGGDPAVEASALQDEAVAGMKKSLEQAWFNDRFFGACKAVLQATKTVTEALKAGDDATARLWLAEARTHMEKARQAATEQRDESE